MNAPKNSYGLPITLSLISKNNFSGGVFDSLKWVTVNTNHPAFSDDNYLYIPLVYISFTAVQWAVVKIRLSDLSIQLFLSYNCKFPFLAGLFNLGLCAIPRGDESFYFSCPALAGWGGTPAMLPFVVSTKREFTPNEIVRMNTNFLNDANIYPCIGEAASYGMGIISDGATCLEITSSEYINAYTRRFILNDNLARTISHGLSGMRGGTSDYLPDYLHIPQPNANWKVGNLNENLLYINGKYELCGQLTDQSTYTYYMNYGVPIIGATPSDCNEETFSSVLISKQDGFARFNGAWPVTGQNVEMYQPVPDLGLRGFSCCAGFYGGNKCLFISRYGFIVPVIVNALDSPYYATYTKHGLVVVGLSNIMLYNFPTLDFDLYKYMPASPIAKVGVSLSNMARPVSPLGAFRT